MLQTLLVLHSAFIIYRSDKGSCGRCGLESTAARLGGGFPQVHAEQLAANTSLRQYFREFLAECGGLLYLTNGIRHSYGTVFCKVGIFQTIVRMFAQLRARGSVEVSLDEMGELFPVR